MRLYVPATIPDLLAGVPLRGVASTVTPALRAALPDEDEEGLELSAFLTAADLSALQVAGVAAPPRRVVLAVEVGASLAPIAPAGPELAELPSVLGVVDLAWSDVVAVHLDDDDARTAELVRKSSQDDAALEELGDVDLLWYHPSELPGLRAALRQP